MNDELRYRDMYAVVPRAAMGRWQHEPWSVVLSAAERGEDGLSVHRGRPIRWYARGVGIDDVAYLTNGQGGDWEHKTVLHQQNW